MEIFLLALCSGLSLFLLRQLQQTAGQGAGGKLLAIFSSVGLGAVQAFLGYLLVIGLPERRWAGGGWEVTSWSLPVLGYGLIALGLSVLVLGALTCLAVRTWSFDSDKIEEEKLRLIYDNTYRNYKRVYTVGVQ